MSREAARPWWSSKFVPAIVILGAAAAEILLPIRTVMRPVDYIDCYPPPGSVGPYECFLPFHEYFLLARIDVFVAAVALRLCGLYQSELPGSEHPDPYHALA
jgi:hypothetical protein